MTIDEAMALSERQIVLLWEAYLERKRFESRVLLSELGNALQPKESKGQMSLSALAAMGFGIEGYNANSG